MQALDDPGSRAQVPPHLSLQNSQEQPWDMRRSTIHSLFQCLPQVLEPALRRHQLLELINQSLRLQETKMLLWKDPHSLQLGVKPAEPQGHSHPALPRAHHPTSCSSTGTAVPWLSHLAAGGQAVHSLPPSAPTSALACSHSQVYHFIAKTDCSWLIGAHSGASSALSGSAPVPATAVPRTSNRNSSCSPIMGPRSPENQLKRLCVCVQLQGLSGKGLTHRVGPGSSHRSPVMGQGERIVPGED